MRAKSVKPSVYPPLPFHLIRFAGFLSSLLVSIILAVFIYNLHKENYKLPFAFLILIVTSILSLLNYVLTSITHCCYGLSPRLSMTCNTILILLWLISLGLLGWCMSHTILTTCNATYWATSTGITVCRIYKTLFAFTVLGLASHIAAVALDVIVNRRQNRLGVYDPMGSSTALNEYKMHDRDSSILSGPPAAPHPGDDPSAPLYAHHRHQPSEDFYDVPDPADRRGRVPAPVYGANSHLEQYHASEAHMYAESAPARGGQPPRVRFSAYDQDGYAHHHPAERSTGYDPGAYR